MQEEQLWKRRREFYKNAATLAVARTEDNVADNICRGLGFSPNSLKTVEIVLGIELDQELPKIQHARTILNIVSHGMFSQEGPGKSKILLDIRDVKNTKKWIDKHAEEYAEESFGREIGVILCTRETDPKSLRAFVFTEDKAPVVQPWLLQPGATFVKRVLGVQMWCRRVDSLIGDMAKYLGWEHIEGVCTE